MTVLRSILTVVLMASAAPLAAAPDATADIAASWIASTRVPTSAPLVPAAPAAAPAPVAQIPATPRPAAPVIYKTAAVDTASADKEIDFSQGGSPHVLDDTQRANYRAVFAALRHAGRPSEAAATWRRCPSACCTRLPRAELFLAKGTPRADVATLTGWLAANPELPQADKLASLARNRGAVDLPALPVERDLKRLAGASRRKGAPTTVGDVAAAAMASSAQKLIAAGKPADAEALLTTKTAELSVDGQVEWQQRIAWGYYITGSDSDMLRLLRRRAQGRHGLRRLGGAGRLGDRPRSRRGARAIAKPQATPFQRSRAADATMR